MCVWGQSRTVLIVAPPCSGQLLIVTAGKTWGSLLDVDTYNIYKSVV